MNLLFTAKALCRQGTVKSTISWTFSCSFAASRVSLNDLNDAKPAPLRLTFRLGQPNILPDKNLAKKMRIHLRFASWRLRGNVSNCLCT